MKETILDLESKHWVFSLITCTLLSSVFFIVTYFKLLDLTLSIKIAIATWPPVDPPRGYALAEDVCKTNVPYEE